MIKSEISNDESVLGLINLLMKQLKLTINDNQLNKKAVFL